MPRTVSRDCVSGTRDYLCYELQCGKRTSTTASVADQFGSRSVLLAKPTWLYAPATLRGSSAGAFVAGS